MRRLHIKPPAKSLFASGVAKDCFGANESAIVRSASIGYVTAVGQELYEPKKRRIVRSAKSGNVIAVKRDFLLPLNPNISRLARKKILRTRVNGNVVTAINASLWTTERHILLSANSKVVAAVVQKYCAVPQRHMPLPAARSGGAHVAFRRFLVKGRTSMKLNAGDAGAAKHVSPDLSKRHIQLPADIGGVLDVKSGCS